MQIIYEPSYQLASKTVPNTRRIGIKTIVVYSINRAKFNVEPLASYDIIKFP